MLGATSFLSKTGQVLNYQIQSRQLVIWLNKVSVVSRPLSVQFPVPNTPQLMLKAKSSRLKAKLRV